jgi:hypothetical protein
MESHLRRTTVSGLPQLDAQSALTYNVSWAYDLPFGKGKALVKFDSRVLNSMVSGWKINGSLKYSSGNPLSIAGAVGNLPQVGYGQWASDVGGVG